jgi:hypothetical protein
MRIKKFVEYGFDIDNPISFASNIEHNLLYLIRQLFEKRCFASCYINRVTRVVKHTDLEINSVGTSTFGKIGAIFEIEGIELLPGEIIPNCLILPKVSDKVTIAMTDIVTMHLENHNVTSVLSEGMYISVEITSCRYQPFSDKIIAITSPFIYPTSFTIYKFDHKTLTPSDLSLMASAHAEIAELVTRVKTLSEDTGAIGKSFSFFKSLLYPYKTANKGHTRVNCVSDRAHQYKNMSGYVMRGPTIYYDDPSCEVIDGTKAESLVASTTPSSPTYVINELTTSAAALITILQDIVGKMTLLCDMAEFYSSSEKMKRNAVLWQVYIKNKIT